VLYHAASSEAVAVPVARSSLLLGPLVASLVPRHRKIGILTYDALHLGERHFRAAGLTGDPSSVVIAGVEGTASWTEFGKRSRRSTRRAWRRTCGRRRHGSCPTTRRSELCFSNALPFCPFTARVRAATGRPVFDFVTLAGLLMAPVVRGRPLGTPALA
jgi:hypothetical protein